MREYRRWAKTRGWSSTLALAPAPCRQPFTRFLQPGQLPPQVIGNENLGEDCACVASHAMPCHADGERASHAAHAASKQTVPDKRLTLDTPTHPLIYIN